VLVHVVVEAGELLQAVLAAKLVEAGHAVLAVADQVERRDVDLVRRRLQPVHLEVLQEAWMVLQRQRAEPLPAHA
jgi:hypothetical protein